MSYQSNGSDVQQYAAVQQSDFDAESGYGRRSGGAASIAAADSSTGATRKVVGVFVAAVVVACVFVAALANLYSTPAVATTAGMATELAAKDAKHVGAAKGKYSGKEPLIVEAHNTEVCDDPNYSSETLKLAHEMSVVALLAKPEAADPGPVFETSCILNLGDWFYAVSDDSPAIAKIRTRLAYNDPLNKLIPPSKPLVDGPQTELGFEALFWDEATGVFTAVIEAVPLDGEPNTFHSMLYDFKIRADESAYDVSGACPSNFEFTSGNKGFEGAALVRDSKGEQYVLGLCEGNFCEGGKRGRTAGNGRVVLLKRKANLNIHGKVYPCGWAQQRVIELPHSIAFRDYSAITLYGSDPTRLRVAIASQENSAVWVGFLNADTWEFTEKDARLFDFPRDGDCEVVYCNVEGLDFLNDNLLVAASDQMKNAGRQSSRCLAKDQSVHVFVIPPVPEVAEEVEKPAKEGKGKEKSEGKGKKAEPAVAMVEGEELKAKEKAEKVEEKDGDAAEEQEKAEKAEKKQKRAAEKQEKEEAEAAKKQKKEAEEAEEKQEKEEKSAKKKAEKAEEKEEKEKADEEKEEKAKAKEAKKEAAEEEEKAERKQKRAEKKQKEEAEEQEEAQAKAERKAKREAKRAAEKQEKEQKEEAEKQEKAEKEAEKKAAKAASKKTKESKKKSAEADD